jgi:hypothetical protein
MLDARTQQGLHKHVVNKCAKCSETWCVFILRKKNRVDVSRGLQPDGATGCGAPSDTSIDVLRGDEALNM